VRLQKYDSYKDSGVEWLGEIPSEWEVKKLKYVLNYKKGKNPISFTSEVNEDIYLTMEYLREKTSNIQYIKETKGLIKVTENNYLLLWDGANAGEFIRAKNGYLSSTMAVINIDNLESKIYGWYYLKFIEYELRKLTNGMGIPHVNSQILNNLLFTVPPLQEQQKIALFLDTKTQQLDKAIKQKEQLIKLLKERKQIVINEAVTKGLDKTVTMKDSGVEWIGKIPKHWEVKKLKYILKINNGQDYKHIVADDGYPVIGSGGEFAKASEYLYDGEVLLLGRKGTINKPLYFIGKFWTVDTMFYAVVKNEYITKFMYYSSLSIPFNYYSTSTALPSMTQFNLNNHQVSIPSKQEQQEIIDFIENQISKIDNVIDLQQKQIDKLKEYKTSLIEAIVTGKVRVCDE